MHEAIFFRYAQSSFASSRRNFVSIALRHQSLRRRSNSSDRYRIGNSGESGSVCGYEFFFSIVYIDHCTVRTALYALHCTFHYTVYFTLYTTVHTLHYAVCFIVHFTLHCTLALYCTLYCTLHYQYRNYCLLFFSRRHKRRIR